MSRSRPSLLIIMNQPLSGCLGQVDGYERLVASGDLEFVHSVAARDPSLYAYPLDAANNVAEAILQSRATHIMVWSPSRFPDESSQFDRINSALKGRPLIYWEGDPWGKGKPITPQMRWWLKRSDIVFSVAGPPQSELLAEAGARHVLPILHTYCHVQFGKFERWSPNTPKFMASFVGNNLARVPGISGVPGSAGRWELATRLRRTMGGNFQLYGRNWPSRWSQGALPYELQPLIISESRVMTNWDHWPTHADYSSDRLAIGLLSGRPQVTTKHPGMAWAPPEDCGFFQESSPGAVAKRTQALLEDDPAKLDRMGAQGRRWVVGRLSHVQAARYVMSKAIAQIEPPNMEPWISLRWGV